MWRCKVQLHDWCEINAVQAHCWGQRIRECRVCARCELWQTGPRVRLLQKSYTRKEHRMSKLKSVNLKAVGADLLKYATAAVTILTLIMNAAPGLDVPAQWQAVILSVVTVLTGVISTVKQLETTKAVAATSAAKTSA